METHLRAGVAIHNSGAYHEAHDAWEDYWLDLDAGTDDERFLHGLIQFTAAVHHAHARNWQGATGLATSGAEYLEGLGETYRGINVGEARASLRELGADPELVERRPVPELTHDGVALELSDLAFPAAAIAAEVFAEEGDYDEGVVEQAVEYGCADLAAGEPTSEFVTLVMDFARGEDPRGIVLQRLREHVDRRRSREEDVDGLFDAD